MVNPQDGIIRHKKWVCYDWYFEAWQARVTPYVTAETQDCQFQGKVEHGSRCGFYLVSIEPIEEEA